MKTSYAVSTVKMNEVELLIKAAGHTYKNFATKFLENLNKLQWMFCGEIYEPAEFKTYYDIYCYIKSSNIDMNEFLENEDCNVYKYAKDYSLKYNKKKISKKDKQTLYSKYYNVFKSQKLKYYILFQQLMYVLLNC